MAHGDTTPPEKRYGIHGWYRNSVAEVMFSSRAEIQYCRGVIAEEAAQLHRKGAALEAKIEAGSAAHKKLQSSKVQRKFDIVVQSMGSGPPRPRSFQKSPLPEPAKPEVSTEQLSAWISQHTRSGFSVVSVGVAETEDVREVLQGIGVNAKTLAALSSAEGQRVMSPSGLAERYRPGPGSLGDWLAKAKDRDVQKTGAYILGSNAEAVSAGMLRGVLRPGQFIVATRASPAADVLLKEWDGRIAAFEETLVFYDAGVRFLDPVTLDPEQDAAIAWPKISVVTVSFNQAQFLVDCLESVLSQNYPNLEYIVIDAVSTDGSIEILRNYEKRLDKLIIEPDRGQSDGLTKGLNLATGDILTWINSDDMLSPGALRRVAQAFLASGADIVAGGCERIGERSDDVQYSHHSALPLGRMVALGKSEQLMWHTSWSRGDYFFQPEILFTRDIWERAGRYLKEHLYWAMDWELWIRMGMAGATVHHIPAMVGRSREHEAQKTTAQELYLFQLKNILLEYDDALAAIQAQALDLPQGESTKPAYKINQPKPAPAASPGPVPALASEPQATHVQHRSLLRRIAGRAPPGVKQMIANRPRTVRDAIGRTLPAPVLDRIRALKSRARYGLVGTRMISAERHSQLLRAEDAMQEMIAASRRLREREDGYQRTVAELKLRCRDLSSELVRYHDWEERELKKSSPNATDTMIGFLSRAMYGSEPDENTRRVAGKLLANGAPVEQALRVVALRSQEKQSSPGFIAARQMMVEELPLPLPVGSEAADAVSVFTIVDIGSEPLAFEEPAYAGLLKHWPTLTVGFDPFDTSAPHRKSVGGESGTPRAEYLTLPYFIGAGEPALFRVAQMQPTSSLYPPNDALAGNFSLLKEAMATVETRDVMTHRLDDVLEKEGVADKPIDFLKIDVQGGTLPVLDGAGAALKRTLLVHLEAEFSPIYEGESLFFQIDGEMRRLGFQLLDFANIGRQRYNAFDTSRIKLFHTGRLLWADCVYVRSLDEPEKLSDAELLRLAVIAHEVYKKYDLAAHALRLLSARTGSDLHKAYIANLA